MSAAARIADSRARLLAAADRPDIPPGALPNLLGAIAKLDIASLDIEPDPADAARAHAALERASTRHAELLDLLQMYAVRLLELHQDAVRILAELDAALAGYHSQLARDLRFSLSHAHHTLASAHGYATSGPWDPRNHTILDRETGETRPQHPDLGPPPPDPTDSPGESPP